MKRLLLSRKFLNIYLFLQKLTTREEIAEMQERPGHIFSDAEILEGIRRGDPHIIKYLRNYSIPFLKNLTGKIRDAHPEEEIFQDELTKVFKKIHNNGNKLQCHFPT